MGARIGTITGLMSKDFVMLVELPLLLLPLLLIGHEQMAPDLHFI